MMNSNSPVLAAAQTILMHPKIYAKVSCAGLPRVVPAAKCSSKQGGREMGEIISMLMVFS